MLSRLITAWAFSLILVAAGHAEERDRDQPYQGMDVIGAVKKVKEAIAPTVPEVSRGKPWEDDIAALTSSDPHRYNPAISNLIRRGPAVLPDLTVLAEDRDWQIRLRVVRVAAYIGGETAASLVLARTHDEVVQVCIEAATDLGQVKGAAAYGRLVELLQAPEPDVRRAAATGLGWLGDVRAIDALLVLSSETDDLAKRDMRNSLNRVALQPAAVPVLMQRLAELHGVDLKLLIEISGQIGDPRLCPVLAALVADSDGDVAQRAARSLSANGDSRALAALIQVAEAHPVPALQKIAAETLRRLTGYEAAPGTAWHLWWQQHRTEVEHLMPRDAFIASLYDPERQATRTELAAFPVGELVPLLDGALGAGPAWWPPLAFRAMAVDDAARWTELLAARIRTTRAVAMRLPLLVLLDQLGDPAARAVFREVMEQKDDTRQLSSPERAAAQAALERRRS